MIKQFSLLKVSLNCLSKSKMPYYAVANGRRVGIFDTWEDCKEQVNGFKGPKYKKFKTKEEANEFLKSHGVSPKAGTFVLDEPIAQAEAAEFWPETEEVNEADDDFLIAASEEVEGIVQRLPAKRKSENDGSRTANKRSHTSKVWSPVGFKTIGKLEFPIDSEGYVIVYTDGSCEGNGQADAVAGFGVYFGEDHPLNTAKPVTGRATNNVGEIQASIYAIRTAKNLGIKRLCLSTDSQFLINSITLWVKGWKRNQWKTGAGQPVKNKEDFEVLDQLLSSGDIDVKWNYVKGHGGIIGNERADKLARKGAQMYREQKQETG